MFVNSISKQDCKVGAIFPTPTPPVRLFKIFRLHLFIKELRLQLHHKCATPATPSSSSSPFSLSLQSGVATAYHLSPNRPVFNVRLLRTNFLHIFFHYI